MSVRSIDTAIATLVQATVASPPNLVSEVDRFRRVREKTIRLLGEVSEAQGKWIPREGVWSIAQIADHLLRSDELFRGQFQRLIQMVEEGSGSVVRVGLSEVNSSFAGIPRGVMRFFDFPMRVVSQFVPHVLRETIIRHAILPAMNPMVTEPRPGLTAEKLRADLGASLLETERLLLAPMPADVEESTIDHPILGSNTLMQLFQITIAHEEKHREQMEERRAQREVSCTVISANQWQATRSPAPRQCAGQRPTLQISRAGRS